MMNDIYLRVLDAHEVQRNLGQATLEQAIEVFRRYPWAEQARITEQTQNIASVTFDRGAEQADGFLNISAEDDGYVVIAEVYQRGAIGGFLSEQTAALCTDVVPADYVEEWIRKFFELPVRELFETCRTEGVRNNTPQ